MVCFEGTYHARIHLFMPMTCRKVPFRGQYDPLGASMYHVPSLCTYRTSWVNATAWCFRRFDLLFTREVYLDHVAAIVIEQAQGEGGGLAAPVDFMGGLREVCDDDGIEPVFCEHQTGWGRIGVFCASAPVNAMTLNLTSWLWPKPLGFGIPGFGGCRGV